MQSLILTLAQAAALIRIRALPGRRMIWFEAYLWANAVRTVALGLASAVSQNTYGYTWLYTEPLIEVLWAGMALELYSRVADLYPGLSRRGWLAAALAVAVPVTMGTLIEPHATLLQNLFLARRVTATILAIGICLLAAFFGYFRNSLPSNSVIHAAVMAFYFLTQIAGLFGANLTGRITDWSIVQEWGAIASYIAWAALLNSHGESRIQMENEFTVDELERIEDGGGVESFTQAARQIGRGNSAN